MVKEDRDKTVFAWHHGQPPFLCIPFEPEIGEGHFHVQWTSSSARSNTSSLWCTLDYIILLWKFPRAHVKHMWHFWRYYMKLPAWLVQVLCKYDELGGSQNLARTTSGITTYNVRNWWFEASYARYRKMISPGLVQRLPMFGASSARVLAPLNGTREYRRNVPKHSVKTSFRSYRLFTWDWLSHQFFLRHDHNVPTS